MANVQQFNLQLDAFAKKIGIAGTLIQKRVAFDLFGRIVKKTPVDTGRARASWNMDVNQPNRTVQPEGQASYPEPRVGAINVKPGDEIWISNNLPYIGELETGHSQQAPHGMMALSIVEIEQQLRALEQQAVKEAGL